MTIEGRKIGKVADLTSDVRASVSNGVQPEPPQTAAPPKVAIDVLQGTGDSSEDDDSGPTSPRDLATVSVHGKKHTTEELLERPSPKLGPAMDVASYLSDDEEDMEQKIGSQDERKAEAAGVGMQQFGSGPVAGLGINTPLHSVVIDAAR